MPSVVVLETLICLLVNVNLFVNLYVITHREKKQYIINMFQKLKCLNLSACIHLPFMNDLCHFFSYHTSLKTLHELPFKIWPAFDHLLISCKVLAL